MLRSEHTAKRRERHNQGVTFRCELSTGEQVWPQHCADAGQTQYLRCTISLVADVLGLGEGAEAAALRIVSLALGPTTRPFVTHVDPPGGE